MRLFSEQIRADSEPDWRAAVEHRFVCELANDQISDDAYARYLVLDYAFLDILVAHVGQAVTTAPGMIAKRRYADFLGVLTGGEDDYFLRSFAAMGIAEDVWRKPINHPVVSEFRTVMLDDQTKPAYGKVLAALLAVEWVYLTWAKSVADHAPARFFLKEWIDLHTDPGFETFVNWMRSEMDGLGAVMSSGERRDVHEVFNRSVSLEVAFFDAAYDA